MNLGVMRLHSLPAVLEVMDKEPSLVFIWGLALGVGWAAFATAREWRWGWLVCVPVLLVATLPMLNEQYDPVLGPMMWAEAGLLYRALSHLAILLMWSGALAGWLARRRAPGKHLRDAV